MYTKWILNEKTEPNAEISNLIKNDFLTKLLLQRGIDTPKRVNDFLYPLKMSIVSPYAFKDMQKAVERIFNAIEKQEQIIVWGDFDADGVTSTAVLLKTLQTIGAKVEHYIPSRETENHGLNSKALVKMIAKKKLKLLITVDCGISNAEEIKFLQGFKVDTIVTDHHDFDGDLPEAFAILNPKVKDNLNDSLGVDEILYLSYLAGVGVAFKLACALLEKVNKNEFIDEILPFVGIGTIADVVPILGENRCLVTCALQLISKNKNKGIARLLSSTGYNIEQGVTSEMIAFGIAPRINAAGRLSTAETALKLLVSDNVAEIEVAAEELNCLNKIRQELCDRTFEEATAQIKTNKTPVLVLFSQNWHIGIIGIVASKIVEKYNKPVFMMTKSEQEPNIVRCSARGINGLNLYEIIKTNEKLFKHFGGHKLAAGLAFDEREHSINEVKEALNSTVKQMSQGLDLTPIRMVDAEISESELNFELIENMQILEPCGEGNPNPVLVMNELVLKSFRTMGANNNHSKFTLEKSGKTFEAVLWNNSEQPIKNGEKMDILFYPKINEYNSQRTIQLDIQDFHFEGQEKENLAQSDCTIKIYDHRKKTDIYKQVAMYLDQTEENVIIFAQSKKTIEKLSKISAFSSRIKNKTNLEKADQIMFFDYPSTLEEMHFIIEETEPDKIHLMNFILPDLSIDEILKTISGMLKYVYNNKNGEVDVEYLSSVLNLSTEFVQNVVELFGANEIIKIKNYDGTSLELEFLAPKEMQTIKEHTLYQKTKDSLEAIQKFRRKLLEIPVSEIQKLIDIEHELIEA